MKTSKKLLPRLVGFVVFVAAFLLITNVASAAGPSFLLTALRGDQVQIIVQGDPYSAVQLYTNGQFVANIGSTDWYGYFGTVVNANSYGIGVGQYASAVVNGQQSLSVPWPRSVYPYNNFITNYQNYFQNQYVYTYSYPASIISSTNYTNYSNHSASWVEPVNSLFQYFSAGY